MTEPTPSETDGDTLLRFVEQFAFILMDSGLARMPARVFAYVLADDAETYTASELAEGLRVSPAAISGAVRTLVQAGLLAKEREPGSRADHYRIYDDDVWSHIVTQRMPMIQRWETTLEEGIRELGPTRGAARLAETRDYMRFFREELLQMQERWRKYREQRRLEREAESEVGEQLDR